MVKPSHSTVFLKKINFSRLFSFIAFLFFILITSGCKIVQFNFIKNDKGIERNNLVISDFATSLAYGRPECYNNQNEMSQRELKLVEAYKHITSNQLDSALKMLQLLKSEKDSLSFMIDFLYNSLHSLNAIRDSLKLDNMKISFEETDTNYYVVNSFFKNNQPYVEVVIDGKKYIFLIDTGYPISGIIKNRFKNINGITPLNYADTISDLFYNNSIEVAKLISNLSLGCCKVENLIVHEVTKPEINFFKSFFVFMDYDGVIGWDIISKLDLIIDYKNQKILMRKPVKMNIKHQYKFYWLKFPIIELVDCDGRFRRFIFDTGSNMTMLFRQYFNTYNFEPQIIGDKSISAITANQDTKQNYLMVKNVCLNLLGYNLFFNKIPVLDFKYGSILLDGDLGSDLWQDGLIHIDYENSILEYEIKN